VKKFHPVEENLWALFVSSRKIAAKFIPISGDVNYKL